MSNNENLKIVLATGIFFPDVGGPAIHVRKIAEALSEKGYRPVVVAYGDYRGSVAFPFKVIRISNELSPLPRRLKYLLTVIKESVSAKILYAFNLTTAGIPVFMAGKILRKKILIRVPGDPIWERIVEKGQRSISFANYYEQGLYLVDKPRLFKIIKFILPKFDQIVFYTSFLSEIYQKYYGVPEEKISIILNPVSRREPLAVQPASEPTILFAGRFVAYKNLELVIRAFDRVRQKLNKGQLVLIGDGPDKGKLEQLASSLLSAENIKIMPKVGQEELFKYICSSTLGIGPALTEFNPNFILECLSFGRPVLISRENGLSVKLSDQFLFDPESDEELEIKLANFFNRKLCYRYLEDISALDLSQSWSDVINSHLRLLEIFNQ